MTKIDVFSGFLGAGKTTLIKKLIREAYAGEKLVLAVTAPDANETVRAVVSGWIDMALRGDHRALMVDTAEKMYSEKCHN